MGRLNKIALINTFLCLNLFIFACNNKEEKVANVSKAIKNKTAKSVNKKALELNRRSIRILLFADSQHLTPHDQNLLVLKLLDSATSIEKNYYAAEANKLSSLIELGRYTDAIKIIDKIIKGDPNSFRTYMKGGILYMDYLNNDIMAEKYFEKAYQIATTNVKKDKNINNDYNVALSLLYLKSKEVSLSYIVNSLPNYKDDKKSYADLFLIKTLVEKTKLDKHENEGWFKNYNSELY